MIDAMQVAMEIFLAGRRRPKLLMGRRGRRLLFGLLPTMKSNDLLLPI